MHWGFLLQFFVADNFWSASLLMNPCFTLQLPSSSHGRKKASITVSTPTQNRRHCLVLLLCPRLSLGWFTSVLRSDKQNCLCSVFIHTDSCWFVRDGLMQTLHMQGFSSVVWSLEINSPEEYSILSENLAGVHIPYPETSWNKQFTILVLTFSPGNLSFSADCPKT